MDRLENVHRQMPTLVGGIAVTFFKERFKQQNWVDVNTQPWKKRKESRAQRKKNAGRAVLVKSGRLRRSIRVTRKGRDFVAVGTDVPYAQIHNEGGRIRGTVTVKKHTRGSFYMDEVSKPGARKEKWVKKKAGDVQVKSHSRKMNTNIPQRQFMGSSAVLRQKLHRQMQAMIQKALR